MRKREVVPGVRKSNKVRPLRLPKDVFADRRTIGPELEGYPFSVFRIGCRRVSAVVVAKREEEAVVVSAAAERVGDAG